MVGAHRLTEEQVGDFHREGWLGPFGSGCTASELDEVRRLADLYSSREINPIYDMVLGRDLHLFRRAIHDLFVRAEIKRKVEQILGPQLQIWRSDVFPKPAGAEATPWHQANLFLEFCDHPLLEVPGSPPGDWTRLWQVTVWIALEDATPENGCLEVVPCTHTARLTWPLHGREAREYLDQAESRGENREETPSFYIKQDPLIEELLPTKKVLEAKAGQFYIFTQRVVHGSGPNVTDKSRLAINFRVTNTDVKCYGHYLDQGSWEMLGIKLPLDKWGCLLYAGEAPEPPINWMLPPPAVG